MFNPLAKKYLIVIVSVVFTYFVIVPMAFPGEVLLSNIDDLLKFLFVMILFTALFSKFLFYIIRKR